jgi:hypothetical protein
MADLVTGKESPNFRVVSGPPAVIEHQLNELLNEYIAVLWHWCVVHDELILSAVLMHTRIVHRQQLAQTRMPGMRQ